MTLWVLVLGLWPEFHIPFHSFSFHSITTAFWNFPFQYLPHSVWTPPKLIVKVKKPTHFISFMSWNRCLNYYFWSVLCTYIYKLFLVYTIFSYWFFWTLMSVSTSFTSPSTLSYFKTPTMALWVCPAVWHECLFLLFPLGITVSVPVIQLCCNLSNNIMTVGMYAFISSLSNCFLGLTLGLIISVLWLFKLAHRPY